MTEDPTEEVHTAFLDMRRTVADRVPQWTVEYALLAGTSDAANAANRSVQTRQTVVLPFPSVKELPAMPMELARKYPRRMLIVYGIINIDGTSSDLLISPG